MLVVNSNAESRRCIAAVLTAARFEVVVCATAAEALLVLRRMPVGAAVVASTLDDMPGIEFLRACRTRRLVEAIIMTTRRGEISAAVNALREGARDYVAEPVDQRLAQSVREALLVLPSPRRTKPLASPAGT